jgi:hypothetical protein
MMIASWIHDSVSSQVVSTRLSISPSPASLVNNTFEKLAEAIRREMPRSATGRSRTA